MGIGGSETLSVPRMTTLGTSLLVALSSGTNYVVSAYAPQLGARLHLTHTQLNYVALGGNVGVYTSGPIFGKLVDKYGPRPLLASAFVFLLSGYSGIRALYDAGLDEGEQLSKFHLVMLIVCGVLTGLGGNAGLTSAINATANSFPDVSRGTVVGIVISGFGLSAFFFSSLSHILFPGNTSDFLLILALGTALPMILGFFFVRRIPLPEHAREHAAERGAADTYERLSTSEPRSPFTKPNNSHTHLLAADADGDVELEDEHAEEVREHRRRESAHAASLAPVFDAVELSPSASTEGFRARVGGVSDDEVPYEKSKHWKGQDISGRALWMSGDFWLMCFTNMLLSGTGLMYINNVGVITQALFAKNNPTFDTNDSTTWQAAQVSIISVANFAGRVIIGVLADAVKSRLRYPRSFCIPLVAGLFILSQLVLIGTDSVQGLWKASAVLGLAYGSMFGLFPTVVIEWFGLAHFSENWGYVSLSPIVGGNLFSIAFGRNLDAHDPPAPANSTSTSTIDANSTMSSTATLFARGGVGFDASHQCLDGRACYVGSLYFTLLATVVALALGVWAGWRDYRLRGYAALRERGAGVQDEDEDDRVPWQAIAAEE
ncbi:MFS general substrate transporter [Dentipellis sp. KUC8613]|nr:MFS general substrate transporter [Dentipellis sp. KUC8613]